MVARVGQNDVGSRRHQQKSGGVRKFGCGGEKKCGCDCCASVVPVLCASVVCQCCVPVLSVVPVLCQCCASVVVSLLSLCCPLSLFSLSVVVVVVVVVRCLSVLSQMGCASCAMPSMSMLFQAYDSLNPDGFPFDFSDLLRYSGASFAPKYASDAFSADIEFLGLAICLLRREPWHSS